MSMSDRACLVTLEIKSPGFRKTSKRGSAELASNNDAENDRVAASVALLPRVVLSKISKLASSARKLVEGTSAPWQGKARVMQIPKMSELRSEFDKIKADYDAAKIELKLDFEKNQDKYLAEIGKFSADFVLPTWAQIEAKLSMELNFLPLPGASSDWRLKLQEEELELMQAGIKASIDAMAADNRQRATDALNQMLERVSAYKIIPDDSAKSGERIEGAFHQSALDNLRETAEMLRGLNFLDDQNFADICDEMERIGRNKANELKSSEAYRESVLDAAEALRDRIA